MERARGIATHRREGYSRRCELIEAEAEVAYVRAVVLDNGGDPRDGVCAAARLGSSQLRHDFARERMGCSGPRPSQRRLDGVGGGRALVVGDYVTPNTGRRAGTLGPWAKVVEAVGIAPRSTLMKGIFLVYGVGYVAVTGAFLLGVSSAWWAMVTLALLGLWYVPFGTLINSIVIILLFLPPLRGLGGSS